MNTRSVSTVSVAVLFALTATASAGPMSMTNSKHIAPPQIQTEPVQYRYYGGYGYGGYGGWNSGAAIAGAALGLLSVGALVAAAGSPYYGWGYGWNPYYGGGYGNSYYGGGYGYPSYGGGYGNSYYDGGYGYPYHGSLRITAGRMVITGGLMPTATRAIAITGLTTSQAIGVTRITGGKTIANMATGRTGSMRTRAAFILDAASGIARRNVDTTGNRASLSME